MIGLLVLASLIYAIEPIHMKDIQALTFYKNGMTGSMRGQPIPQMQLKTTPVRSYHIPDEIHCRNIGWDGLQAHWECEAELEKGWKIVNTEISCEGWSGPGDAYVVPGTCALFYDMKYKKPKEEPKQRDQFQPYTYHTERIVYEAPTSYAESAWGLDSLFSVFIFGTICALILGVSVHSIRKDKRAKEEAKKGSEDDSEKETQKFKTTSYTR